MDRNKIKAKYIKRGQCFIVSDILLWRVFKDGHISTIENCIMGANTKTIMFIHKENEVEIIKE